MEGTERTSGGGPAPSGGGARVLYIEDSLVSIKAVEQLLSARPEVELLAAVEGSEGVAMAQVQQPALIILDLGLPDLPGIEVLEQLRRHPRTEAIPVVVLTADEAPEMKARVLVGGALAYLTKPVDEALFLALLDELLKGAG